MKNFIRDSVYSLNRITRLDARSISHKYRKQGYKLPLLPPRKACVLPAFKQLEGQNCTFRWGSLPKSTLPCWIFISFPHPYPWGLYLADKQNRQTLSWYMTSVSAVQNRQGQYHPAPLNYEGFLKRDTILHQYQWCIRTKSHSQQNRDYCNSKVKNIIKRSTTGCFYHLQESRRPFSNSPIHMFIPY